MIVINSIRKTRLSIFRYVRYYEKKHILFVSLRYFFRFFGKKKHPLPGKLIVSLTSYPPRFSTLHLTLKSLLSQSVTPDLTILWLFKDDIEKLTPKVRALIGEKFEIRAVERDTKSYKKLIPAIIEFPDAYIVTADDDTYYDSNWLRDLVASHNVGQKEVLGHRGHYISVMPDGTIAPYSTWHWDTQELKPDPKVFLTGVGGILYPPGALSAEVLNEGDYLKICPRSDDIWFYFMARCNGFVARKIIGNFNGYSWGETQDVALFHSNVAGGANDAAMQAMVLKFGSPL